MTAFPAASGSMDLLADDDLRIGLIGYGRRGRALGLIHRPRAGSVIAAVLDPSDTARAEAAGAFGATTTLCANLPQILDPALGLDAVIVASPDAIHEEQVVPALEAGLPVYLEKPIAITTASADRILRASERTGTPLYVGHNLRHMPFAATMKEVIDSGAIGEVKTIWCRHFVGRVGELYFTNWHADRRNVNSLLLEKGAHDLDLIHWLGGGLTARVQAFGGRVLYGDDMVGRPPQDSEPPWYLDPGDPEAVAAWPPATVRRLHQVVDVEDISLVNLELDNGVFATYQQCHFTPDYWRNYTVIGTEGRLENFGNGEPGSHVLVWDRRRMGWGGTADRRIEVPMRSGTHFGADRLILADFLRTLRGAPSDLGTATPLAARWAVAAADAATRSLRSDGGPVDVAAPVGGG
ncbi:Gfo/Idh/MocA family protein [Occultella aeris]|uniref:Oxidoreductase YteT n=1 Tax=Occultella aeris TaxID=2761496 RepID=A0A7M4DGK7_9MICO|nr:Gfo/Idh/MocA family oxidoreductase [Occultella aeris]VZO36050.1 Putative oxidoreductase YteT precursor [Occultella aeris]